MATKPQPPTSGGRCLLVIAGVSTRLSADPASAGWNQMLDFRPAENGLPADTIIESELPAHVPVDALIASGHLGVITRAELDLIRAGRAQALARQQDQAQTAADS